MRFIVSNGVSTTDGAVHWTVALALFQDWLKNPTGEFKVTWKRKEI